MVTLVGSLMSRCAFVDVRQAAVGRDLLGLPREQVLSNLEGGKLLLTQRLERAFVVSHYFGHGSVKGAKRFGRVARCFLASEVEVGKPRLRRGGRVSLRIIEAEVLIEQSLAQRAGGRLHSAFQPHAIPPVRHRGLEGRVGLNTRVCGLYAMNLGRARCLVTW